MTSSVVVAGHISLGNLQSREPPPGEEPQISRMTRIASETLMAYP